MCWKTSEEVLAKMYLPNLHAIQMYELARLFSKNLPILKANDYKDVKSEILAKNVLLVCFIVFVFEKVSLLFFVLSYFN